MAAADVAFLHRESRTAPQHVGGIAVFAAQPPGFDYDRLVRLIEERISLAPRYRQKVRFVPGNLAHPLWVDDPRFDITYHVRRSALPRPGTDEQLLEFGARILARPLDRSRPLWEMYLVEGLAGDRVAVVTKTHEAMINEAAGIDLTQVILDAAPTPRGTVAALWMPGAEPGSVELVRDAILGMLRRPLAVADTAHAAARELRGTAARAGAVAGVAVHAGRAVFGARPASALQTELGEHRRLAIARTRLDDYRHIRDALGGSVNDAVLAVVTGALRGWLLFRAVPVRRSTSVRALVPVGIAADGDDGAPRQIAAVRPLLVDLPVGEPDPVLRLAQLRYAMASHRASGRAVRAAQLASIGGFAPPTIHALGARASTGLTRRMFSLVVTNVPGPQRPLYAAGARMSEIFPFQPLSPGQAVSIALTSYDGGVYYGLNGDRDAMTDIATLGQLIEESLAELRELAAGARGPHVGSRGAGNRPEAP